MEKQENFLRKVASFLVKDTSADLSKTLVVFPNHRTGTFLKKYLVEKFPSDSWFPEMITIDDFMERLSGLTLVDPLMVDFELYQVHRRFEGEHARSLDDFLSWAPLMLNDFSDIDYHLIDAKAIFSELSEVKALERWNLDGQPLTDIQKSYLKFFHSLFGYYENLQVALLKEKTAYKAMAYRYVVEHYEKEVKKRIQWGHFVFVGFNALTEAEKTFISTLKNDYQLDYLIDADSFYYENEKGELHEAGQFLRQALKSLKIVRPNWVENHLLTDEKTIEVIEAPKHMGQISYAVQVLQQWFSVENYDPADTVIVLAEEGLLIPLLSSVPIKLASGEKLHYNVSLGYPLSDGPFSHFLQYWLELLILKKEDAKGRIFLPSLLALLKNPLIEFLAGPGLNQVISELKRINISYIEEETLLQMQFSEDIKTLFNTLFHQLDAPVQFFPQLITLLQKLQSVPALREKDNMLLSFQLVLVFRLAKIFKVMLDKQLKYLSFKSLQKIIAQEMNRQKINLKGQPLIGVQVMGVLETRNLDFEHVIVLSANEGILPKAGFQDSFIPFDLRKTYGLPLPKTKTAIFSYHFFRLLQRARHMVYIFNSEPDIMGSGEPSRFVRQIEHELLRKNPNIKFKKKVVNVPLRKTDINTEIQIEKNQEVREKLYQLAENGISPSALNTYINCTLQFYFRYILRVVIPVQLESYVQSDTFGSVVHGVLEALYTPFTGKIIDPQALEKELLRVDTLLKEKFNKYYGLNDLNYGKNLLIYHVAKTYIERYVKNDLLFLKKQERQLVGVEIHLKASFTISGRKVNIKGVIDRVDCIPGAAGIRIIDYKTGNVNGADLKIKDWESLITDTKYAKAFQVLSYAWLYLKKRPSVNVVRAGIVSLKTVTGKPLEISFENDTNIKTLLSRYEKSLKKLLYEIFSENKSFNQTEYADHCSYCDFKNLCNR